MRSQYVHAWWELSSHTEAGSWGQGGWRHQPTGSPVGRVMQGQPTPDGTDAHGGMSREPGSQPEPVVELPVPLGLVFALSCEMGIIIGTNPALELGPGHRGAPPPGPVPLCLQSLGEPRTGLPGTLAPACKAVGQRPPTPSQA